jgi:hypothetical protein
MKREGSGNAGFVVDSALTFQEAVAGTAAPRDVLGSLRLLAVEYLGFDGLRHRGQLVVHEALEAEVGDLFRLLERLRFPVARVVPIVRYGWSDDASMADNNSSAFNYRVVDGTDRLSRHAFGRAVDVNPFLNPVVYRDGRVSPPGASWRPERPGTLSEGHPVVLAFLERGWRWGGRFEAYADYHHFDKI